MTYSDPAAAYFVTPARIWELSIGGIIVFLPEIKHRDLRLLLPWFGLALIAYTFIQWNGTDFPGWKAFIPTVATALVIWGGASAGTGTSGSNPKNAAQESPFSVANIARFRPAQFFGDISYSLYLWHWPLIVLVPFYLGTDLNHHNSKLKVAIFLASIIISWLSYKFVESPTRHLGARSSKPIRTVAVTWLAGITCLAAVLLPAHAVEVRATDYTENIVAKAFERAMDPDDIGFGARATMHRGEDGVPENPYGQTDPEWAQFGSSHVHGTMDDPNATYGYSIAVDADNKVDEYGVFGDTESDKIILVMGDSHSQHWYPAIDVAARNLGYKVFAAPTVLGAGGLFLLESDKGDTWTYHGSFETTLSVVRNNGRFEWVKENLWPQASVVLIGVSNSTFTVNDSAPSHPADAPIKVAETFRAMEDATGRKPILIQDNPLIAGYTDQKTWIDRVDKKSKDVLGQMNLLRDKLNEVGASDTFAYLEVESLFLDDKGNAHTQIGGVPVNYDGNHVNTLYSASCGEYFTEQLRALGL
jgi:hypothetical protein